MLYILQYLWFDTIASLIVWVTTFTILFTKLTSVSCDCITMQKNRQFWHSYKGYFEPILVHPTREVYIIQLWCPVTGVLSKSQLWLKSIQAFYGHCTHQRYQISNSMDGRFQYFLSPAIFYWGIFQCCVRAQVLTLYFGCIRFTDKVEWVEYDNQQFCLEFCLIAIWKMRVCFSICLQRAIKESVKTPKALTSEFNGNRCSSK